MLRFWAYSSISHDKLTPLTFKMAPKDNVVEWNDSFQSGGIFIC